MKASDTIHIFKSQYITIKESPQLGWRPQAIYELLGIRRQKLYYWRDVVYPKTEQKMFSTYEILLFHLIMEIFDKYGIQLKIIKEVDWNAILNEIQEKSFSDLDDVILKINIKDCSFSLLDNNKEIDKTDRGSIFLDVGIIFKELLAKILDFGSS